MPLTLREPEVSILRFARNTVLLFHTMFGMGAVVFGQAPAPARAVNSFDASVDALIKKVSPSIVQIIVTAYAPLGDESRGQAGVVLEWQRASGSGFIIDPDGYHCYERARRKRCTTG